MSDSNVMGKVHCGLWVGDVDVDGICALPIVQCGGAPEVIVKIEEL